MEIVIRLISVLSWITYAYLDGRIEAHYYDALIWSNRKHKDIHWMSFVQRGIILIIIGVATNSVSFPCALVLIISYIHNGFYYKERNKLDESIYIEKFKAESTTSTALFEFKYNERLNMFIVGAVLTLYHIVIVSI